jgi:MMPL family
VFVFGSFVLNGDPTIKQFGVGLAVAVILDATVVRCLLVPALMILMGNINWWMPRWLDRVVPHTSIEGRRVLFAARRAPGGRGCSCAGPRGERFGGLTRERRGRVLPALHDPLFSQNRCRHALRLAPATAHPRHE